MGHIQIREQEAMNKINVQFVGSSAVAEEVIIKNNVHAWQEEAKRRREKIAAGRKFCQNFGRPNFSLPKGFALATS